MSVRQSPKNQRKRNSTVKRPRKSQNVVSKLLLGLVAIGLLAGVGYGVLLLSSIHSLTAQLSDSPPHQKQTTPIPITEPPPQSNTPPPSPPEAPEPEVTAKATPSKQEVVEEVEEEPEFIEEEAPVEENIDDGEMLKAQEMMAQEIFDLKQAMPDNRLIPVERTEAEAQELLQEMEEMQSIKELIDQDAATYSDRERYYDIQAKNFEDEIELINFCNDRVGSSMGSADNPNGICSNISKDSERRLQEIQKTMEQLQQELLM